MPGLLRERLDRQALHEALEDVWRVVRAGNGYIDRQAPWALKKTDPVRMKAVLRVLADVLRVVATVLQPYMPGSMDSMLGRARSGGAGLAFARRHGVAATVRHLPTLR